MRTPDTHPGPLLHVSMDCLFDCQFQVPTEIFGIDGREGIPHLKIAMCHQVTGRITGMDMNCISVGKQLM